MTDKPTRTRHWVQRSLALIVGGLLSLVVLEGALRVWSRSFHPRMMTADRALGWRHLPDRERVFTNEDGVRNLVVQNGFGHRGADTERSKATGVYRVLVLGDSFTEAVQVGEDEVYTRRLEASFEDVEVLNAGVGGWGTVQQYLYLRDAGLAFEPDLVLVVSFTNDLADNCTSYSSRIGGRPFAVLEDGELRIVEDYDDAAFLRFVAPLPFRGSLVRNSYLFYAANDRVWQPMWRAEIRAQEDADRLAIGDEVMHGVFVGVVREVRDLAARRGIPVAFVLIPRRDSVAAGEDRDIDRMLAGCAGLDVPALSLLPVLGRAHGAGARPYFDVDIHWTEAGHAAAAAAIAPFIYDLRHGAR